AARAAVARFWALMFGRSMTETVDDIPLHGPLPTGMDRLADDFVEHKFDIRRVIRAIAYSSPFQRDSRSFDFDITQAHEDAWAAFPLSRLRPEQVAGCIVQASRLKTIDDQSSILTQLQSFNSINDFITRYGDTGQDEFDEDPVTITQRLLMLNGKVVDENADTNPVLNASSHIDMFADSDQQAIEVAYLAVLNRPPSQDMIDFFSEKINQEGNRERVLVDLFWQLMNSSEMAFNH
ncbi:MAG: DUF1553 domain-containing protein, partial [Planctomycetota bacterium]